MCIIVGHLVWPLDLHGQPGSHHSPPLHDSSVQQMGTVCIGSAVRNIHGDPSCANCRCL